MEEIIITEDLSKEYGDIKAVSEVNLEVKKGEIFGFLGLNGAGKTTTIRMLLGMIRPTSGSAYISGEKVHANNNKLWKKIGYLVEVPHSYQNLTVRENLEIIRRLRLIKNNNSVDRIINLLELKRYANRKAKNLSLGNSQRLGLAKALIHNPEILILDEPTNGLDPAGIHEVREMLIDLAENHGVTIFISSHILGEISIFSTRIGIIHNGSLIKEFNTDELDTLCEKNLFVQTNDLKRGESLILKNGYSNYKIEDDIIKISDLNAINKPEEIATMLVNENCPPTLLQVQQENLESYFLRTIKRGGAK